MRRAVITGLGAVSCIGNNKEEILDSLKNGRSGIVANETFKEMGLRSQVSGSCEIDFKEHIDRKPDRGLRWRIQREHRQGSRYASFQGCTQNRSLWRYQDNGQYGCRMSCDAIQNQRH
jgi:3-oxoacyl-(acyl-carrier-protein) synthase